MNTSTRSATRTLFVAVRAMILATVALGIIYPLIITGIGQLTMPGRADGSMVRTADGRTAGSRLIGQSFINAKGNPLPRYFQSRPSAAGAGYDGASSSGSNLGPNNKDLSTTIAQRKAQIAKFNHVAPAQVPPDAVTASGSGLDPDISTAYADIQINRVAQARHVSSARIVAIVAANTRGPSLGLLGEARVNVLQVNLALDHMKG